MKVAVVHDYLTTYAGGERVTKELLAMYPQADVFTLIDILERDRDFLGDHAIHTSFLQRVPGIRRHYRNFFPLFPRAIASLDVSDYDLVISNSHSVAKGIRTSDDQLHVSICLSPARWAWDLEDQYVQEADLDKGLKGWLLRRLLARFRAWDRRSHEGVDAFISISEYIKERVSRLYRRDSMVIYPPVDTEAFPLKAEKQDYFLVASRLVWYKKARIAIEAFNHIPEKRLIVAGGGPQLADLRALAGPNVDVLGHVSQEKMRSLMQNATALIFPPEEDFGIVPVEAQACGTPVLAYGRGGATETVVDGETGLFFHEQTATGVMDVVRRFEEHGSWDPSRIRENALRFGIQRFHDEMASFVDAEQTRFQTTA